ncbi:MAG: GNAT family N-acetyltransferase [Stackebrandtia sp.]
MSEGRFPVTEWDAKDLRLRLLRDSDVDDVVEACGDAQTLRFLWPYLPSPFTRDQAGDFVSRQAPQAWKDGRAQWAVADLADDRLLGVIGVPRISGEGSVAELGYWTAPWARGKGVAAAAIAAAADFLIAHGVERVELMIATPNIASQRAALRAGFSRDGVLRGRSDIRDPAASDLERAPRCDMVVYSRMPGDPPGPTPRDLPDLPGGELSDGVAVLRPFGPEHVDACLTIGSLPEVWQDSVPAQPPTRESLARLCGYASADQWLAGHTAHMVIVDAVSGDVAGQVGVHNRMGPPGQVMLSYALNREFRGRGMASRAVRLAARWAFESVGAARVTAGTNPDNVASQAVLERIGFKREGYERSLRPGMDGKRVDNVAFCLLPEEL